MKICSQCQVNPVSGEDTEHELCTECLEEQGNGDYIGELNFDKPDYRRDDRMLMEPVDTWEENEDET